MRFSVVIPTLNETDNIDPLLTRLFALDLPKDSFEVIIVDDGSKDGTLIRFVRGKENLLSG